MSFQSLPFLLFLAAAALVCPALSRRNRRAGEVLLTLGCLGFYLAGGGWRAFGVLAAGTVVTALVLRVLAGESDRRRTALALGCAWQIAVLLVCKLTGWMPLGVSFFTFQQLWLLKEAYTRQSVLRPGDNLVLYAFFFPTVTSGPILRPDAFFPQLRGEGFLRPDWSDAAAGLYAISLGMAKKVLLADPLGAVVANGWALGADRTAPAAWIVILGYTLQLYLDFSGYCDIAAGCALLLGIHLPVNFDSPYRALSVGEFWKRWHVTLTTFLRECLYFPLGGSRKGTARTCCNILIVYLVSGLWHGTGWTFLVWGGLHGLAQIAERLWPGRERLPKAVRWGITFLFVNLAWVFFQAPSLTDALGLLRSAVTGGWGLPLETLAAGALDSETAGLQTLLPVLEKWVPGMVLAALLGIGLAVSLRRENVIRGMEAVRSRLGSAVLCAVLLAWAVASFSSTATFIYSNF